MSVSGTTSESSQELIVWWNSLRNKINYKINNNNNNNNEYI